MEGDFLNGSESLNWGDFLNGSESLNWGTR